MKVGNKLYKEAQGAIEAQKSQKYEAAQSALEEAIRRHITSKGQFSGYVPISGLYSLIRLTAEEQEIFINILKAEDIVLEWNKLGGVNITLLPEK